MAKAKKLPSGNWRVIEYIERDDNGNRVYKSFTAESPKEAEYAALEYKLKRKKEKDPENLTVGEAIDKYISIKSAVLSPATVREYKQERRNNLQSLMALPLSKLTQEAIQRAVNTDAMNHSYKTIRNAHGLLSSTLKIYKDDMILRTKLPQKTVSKIQVPDQTIVNKLLGAVSGTDMELPILLAATMGLRRSEICGLRWSRVDLDKSRITIDQAMVIDAEKIFQLKAPKSTAGYRTIDMPPFLADKFRAAEKAGEYVVSINPDIISNRFSRIVKELDIQPPPRFHDLRHYHASIMLALNVPDKYAMERMGHATSHMLKQVYQHTMQNKKDEVSEIINNYMQHEMQHAND